MRVLIAVSVCSLAIHSPAGWADSKAGSDVFFAAGCIACHAIGCNRAGPRLGGVMGRKAGSLSDYADYSDAMKNSGIVWSEDTLDAYLANPGAMVPGNGMAAAGNLEDAQKRRAVIAFLKDPDESLDICL